MTILSILITCLRIVVGAILFLAGAAKLSNFDGFVIILDSYQLLPIGLVKPLSYLIVSAEIIVGIVLVIGYFSKGASTLAAFLFVIFAVSLAIVVWKKTPLADCGCGNFLFSLLDMIGFQISTTVSWRTVFMDVALAAVSFGTANSPHQGYGLESLLTRMRAKQ